jgi:gamma-glutamylputrescine oxidase
MTLTTPVWSEHQPPPCPFAPRGTLRADTAVIGAGLTGLSAAHHLLRRRPGARLVVLEAERIGAGASGRSTGLLGPGVGQSLVALVRRQGPARARSLYVATLRAVQDVCRLVQDEGIECELEMTGHLIVARSAADRVRVAAHAALLRALGLPARPSTTTRWIGSCGSHVLAPRRTTARQPCGSLWPGRSIRCASSAAWPSASRRREE